MRTVEFRAIPDTDFELQPVAQVQESRSAFKRLTYAVGYVLAGIFFGILLIKAEVVSWYRIQEMFRLQSFHMYGVIGSAVATGALSVWLIKRFNLKTADGSTIVFTPKKFHQGTIYGGLLFGLGWALTGACPGPLFALIGAGGYAYGAALISAVAGTWVYGLLREKLPH